MVNIQCISVFRLQGKTNYSVKSKFFPKKGLSEIFSKKFFSLTPKLSAKSPPMTYFMIQTKICLYSELYIYEGQ